MATEVRVDPALLEAKAGVTADLRAGLDRELTDVEPETTQVVRELPRLADRNSAGESAALVGGRPGRAATAAGRADRGPAPVRP
ncbi:hypothetical protein GCM10027615_71820 [Plantactinospora veratri]